MNVCLWWLKKQQKTSRFMASSNPFNDSPSRPPAIEMAHQFNCFTMPARPVLSRTGTRSYCHLVNMPRGKPQRVGCLIFKTAEGWLCHGDDVFSLLNVVHCGLCSGQSGVWAGSGSLSLKCCANTKTSYKDVLTHSSIFLTHFVLSSGSQGVSWSQS